MLVMITVNHPWCWWWSWWRWWWWWWCWWWWGRWHWCGGVGSWRAGNPEDFSLLPGSTWDHDEEHPGLDQGYHSPVLPGCVKIIIVFLLFWLWLYVNSIYSMGIVSGHHWKPLKGSEQFWNSPTVHFISGPYFVTRNEELNKLKVLIQNSNLILWLSLS